jgi:hypothetical protein
MIHISCHILWNLQIHSFVFPGFLNYIELSYNAYFFLKFRFFVAIFCGTAQKKLYLPLPHLSKLHTVDIVYIFQCKASDLVLSRVVCNCAVDPKLYAILPEAHCMYHNFGIADFFLYVTLPVAKGLINEQYCEIFYFEIELQLQSLHFQRMLF